MSLPHSPADVPEHTGHAAPARPDFGQAMVDVDVEAARATAVRLEQELAKAEGERDAALRQVRSLNAELISWQELATSAEALVAALSRALAYERSARRGRGVVAWVRRVVSR